MKILAIFFLVIFLPVTARAQSSAQPVLPGFLTTSGCPGSLSPCYLPYSDANPLPVTVSTSGSASPTTNSSSAITTGGTFQTISASSTARKSFDFVNLCNITGNCTTINNLCYIYLGATGTPTTANSIPVGPGQEYLRADGAIPSDAIRVTCDGTADKFYLGLQ